MPKLHKIITWLIAIDIKQLIKLFSNWLVFCNCSLACQLLKDVNVNAKCFFGLVYLTSNYMFSLSDFWDKSRWWLSEILKMHLENLSQIANNSSLSWITNNSQITSTNKLARSLRHSKILHFGPNLGQN